MVNPSNISNQRYVQENNAINNANISKKIEKNEKKTTVSQGPIAKEWPNILNDFKSNGKIVLFTNLINTNAVEINDMTVGIEFPNGLNAFGRTVLEKVDNKNEIEKQVSIACGKQMHVKYIDLKQDSKKTINNKDNVENIMNGLDIPFDVID